MKLSRFALGLAISTAIALPAMAADLGKVGISVGSLANPFFVDTLKGIEDKARSLNPSV